MHSIQWHTLKIQTNQHLPLLPQDGVWVSNIIQNLYLRNFPPKDIQITILADDITITVSPTNHHLRPNNSFNHVFKKSINGPPLIIFI